MQHLDYFIARFSNALQIALLIPTAMHGQGRARRHIATRGLVRRDQKCLSGLGVEELEEEVPGPASMPKETNPRIDTPYRI